MFNSLIRIVLNMFCIIHRSVQTNNFKPNGGSFFQPRFSLYGTKVVALH